MSSNQKVKNTRTGRSFSFLSTQLPINVVTVVSIVMLVAVPILMLVFSAFRGPIGTLPFESNTYFTTENIYEAFQFGNFNRMARDTIMYVTGSVFLALLIGYVLAWIIERTDFPLPGIWFAAIIIPFLFPERTIIMSWLEYLLPRTGDLNIWLRSILGSTDGRGPIDPYNLYTMVIFQGLMLTPIVFLVLAATLRNQNGAMEEASRTSGASNWATVKSITLPLLFPGVFTAAVLSAWLTIDSTNVPMTLGGASKVSLFNFKIWAALNSVDQSFTGFGLASSYALMGMSTLFILFAAYTFITRQTAKYATVTGNTMRAPKVELGYWFLPTASFLLLYLFLMWGLPVYRLIQGSLRAGLSGYGAQLTDDRFLSAMTNSAIMSIGSATLGTAVVVLVAWIVVRGSKGKWKTGLDLLATSSLVIPAVLAGVAFLMVFLTFKSLPLYGTLLGVTYALAYRLAIPYRIANAGMRQIGPDMEEVSATSGGSPFQTLKQITMPLLAPAISVSWTIFFVFAMRESTLIRYLGFLEPTVGGGIRYVRGGPPGSQSAGTVISILFILLVILMVRYLLFRRAKF